MSQKRSQPLRLRRARAGKLNALWTFVLSTVALVVVLAIAMKYARPGYGGNAKVVRVYCAAGVRTPVEQIARMYEEEYGVEVELQFGGSMTLLSQLDINKFSDADLYIAGDDYFTQLAKSKGLARETLPVAHMRPVVAVRKGSDVDIASFEDLLKPGLRISAPNADETALGRAVKDQLSKTDAAKWKQLAEHIRKNGVFKPTVPEVATDVKIGAVDAGIIWDATVASPKLADDLKAIEIAEIQTEPNLVSIAVLHSSPEVTSALKFARYLSARDKGLPVMERFGLKPVEGDVWAEVPQIKFFCGAVNRRVVDKIVQQFSADEGVQIDTIYDGCGILTSRMKLIDGQDPQLGFPDVYMACDVYYLENVKQWFQEAANVSDVEMVIAVPKGSDKVKSLDDLIKPGVRVAVGEPTQCTIGALTARLLKAEGLFEELKKKQQQPGEIVVEKSSSAHLVPDVMTGSVDAAVAYISDVLANEGKVDIVRIDSPMNRAIQPFSIAKTSDHKHLVRRLFKRIASNPEAFENVGFHFRYDPENEEAVPSDDHLPANTNEESENTSAVDSPETAAPPEPPVRES